MHRCQTCDSMADMTTQSSTSATRTIRSKFSVITGACMACLNKHSPKGISPTAHLGDGHLDLILVRSTSRFGYIRYLFRTGYPGANNSPFRLPHVEIHRVKEFTFTPDEGSKTSVWNCDGEMLTNAAIRARVHCQILPVFARGIEKN